MRKPGIDGGFLLCFGLNLLFSAYWAIPAVVLFVAHFVAGTPLWLGWAALILWVSIEFGITAFLSWAVSSGDGNPAGTGTRDTVTTRYSSQGKTDPRENE